jgi:hypothetical protein
VGYKKKERIKVKPMATELIVSLRGRRLKK